MIKLHSLDVTNIRAIGHATFEPLIDGGLTALNGPNGAGKSTLLSALLWCLYGVTPDGVPVAAMRRQGSTEDCQVIATFDHDQQTVTVERGLKGINDNVYVKVTLDGVDQTSGKVRAAEEWVRHRLGLDAEGFLTAFVVRQKELDGLVRARPAERRKVIERLAGVERMSAAVTAARAKETDTKRRLDVLPGSAEAAALAAQSLEHAQQAATLCWETKDAAQKVHASAQATAESATAAASELEAAIERATQAREAHTTATTHATLMAHHQAAAQKTLADLHEAAHGGDPGSVIAAQQAVDDAHRRILAAETATHTAQAARDRANQTAAVHERAIADAAAAAERAWQAQASVVRLEGTRFASDLVEQSAQAAKRQEAAAAAYGVIRGNWDRLNLAIQGLNATQGACCPTCESPVADIPALLANLTAQMDKTKSEGIAAAEEQDAANTARSTIAAQVSDKDRHDAAVAAAKDRAEDLRRYEAVAAQTLTQTAQEAAAAAAAAAASEQVSRRAVDALPTLREAHQTAATLLRAAEAAADATTKIPSAQQAADQARDVLTEAERVATAAAYTVATTAIDPATMGGVRERAAAAVAALRTADINHRQAAADFRVAEVEVDAATRHRDTEQAYLAARASTARDLEQLTATREALDAFRKHRIASLAPELSEVATDLLAAMTDGKFTSLVLDEEFTPVVTDEHGNQRPASWLSGGEESAVALALRLAIGEVIAGHHGGLLWMDEPQTAMDAQRRPAMMAVIRGLPGRQPIIISHVSEATDMVDLVIEVIPDPDEGSTLNAQSLPGPGDVGEALAHILDPHPTAA